LSNQDICQLEAAERRERGRHLAPFNLIHRDAADDVLLWPRVRGDRFYSPMASGLLTWVWDS
jgi:hypothetical protein